MAGKKLLVAIVVIVLLAVVLVGAYILSTQSPPGSAPTVTSISPIDGATGVPINVKILATFSEAMNPASITTSTFTLKQGTTPVPGAVTYADGTATLDPTSNLAASAVYTATITTGAKDSTGSALAANVVWSFTTGAFPDNAPPLVTFVSPVKGATGTAINAKVLATFSEAMAPSTVTTSTFTLKQGTTSVSGTVTYAFRTATLAPTSNLAANSAYTATITTGAKDLAGNALAANFVWSFTTGALPDTTRPQVTSTSPPDTATSVGINTNILASFNEPMDPLTITTSTFTLKQGTTSVSGTVTYAGLAATFNPASSLAANTVYIATIMTGAEDLAGNGLASNFVWSFATGTLPDTTPPRVTFTFPIDAATGVAINANILATFNEAMDPLTITTATFTLRQGTTPVSGTVTYAGRTATFNPASSLAANSAHTATITTGAEDLAGNALAANFVWSFTTGALPDTTPPQVTSTFPVNGATGVAVNTDVLATFNEAMDPLTITTSTFTLVQGTTPVSGTVTYAGLTATFNPVSNLTASAVYTATVTNGAKDLAGNALAANFVWSFTTGSTGPRGPAPVVLGTAGNFVILAKSTITTTGTTSIVGDLGLSPAATSFITGFALTMDPSNEFATSSLVTGRIYAADMAPPTPTAMTTAILDMQNAFTDAAGRTLPDATDLGAGNIDGMTLAPGLYKWGTGVTIPIGVTLSGGADDVWIFQIAQDLTVGNGAIVTLSGGAQAKNIFWQVSGQVILGTTSDFKGIILCQTQIALQTGATLLGRALAQTAVTLDASIVTRP